MSEPPHVGSYRVCSEPVADLFMAESLSPVKAVFRDESRFHGLSTKGKAAEAAPSRFRLAIPG